MATKQVSKRLEKQITEAVFKQQRRMGFKRKQRNMAREMVEDHPEIARRCLALALDESVNRLHGMDGYRFERDEKGVTMIRFNPFPVRNEIVGSRDQFLTADEVLAMFKFNWKTLGL